MSYRKRDIGHWNQGKAYKGSRKAKEREFVERDIDQQIAAEDDAFRYRHAGKRRIDRTARIANQVQWYRAKIEEYERHVNNGHTWGVSFLNYLRTGLKDAERRLEEAKNAVRS